MSPLLMVALLLVTMYAVPVCGEEAEPAKPVAAIEEVTPLGKHILLNLTPGVGDRRLYQCMIDTQKTMAGKVQNVSSAFEVVTEVVEQTDKGFRVQTTVGPGTVTSTDGPTKKISAESYMFETDTLGFPTDLEVNETLVPIYQGHLLRKVFGAQRLEVGKGWRESYVLKNPEILPEGIAVQTLVRVQQHKEVNGQKLVVLLVRTTGRKESEDGDIRLIEVAGNGYLIIAYEQRRIVEYTQNLSIGAKGRDGQVNLSETTFTLKSQAPITPEPVGAPAEEAEAAAGSLLKGSGPGSPGGSVLPVAVVSVLGIAVCGLLFVAGFRPKPNSRRLARVSVQVARIVLVSVLCFALTTSQASADFCLSKALLAIGFKSTPVAIQAYTVWNLGGLPEGSTMGGLIIAILLGISGGAVGAELTIGNRQIAEQSTPAGVMGAPIRGEVASQPPLPPGLADEIVHSDATTRAIAIAAVVVGAAAAITFGCGGCWRGGGGGSTDVTVDSNEVDLTVTDNRIIDGDIIDLIVNGEYILTNHTLVGPPGTTVPVTLKSGENSLVVHADNMGSRIPNTAQLEISNVIVGKSVQFWDLWTGEDALWTITAP